MIESDIIKRLLETERQAKNLIDESQILADRKVEDIVRAKQADFAKSREEKIRELDAAFEKYKTEIEKARMDEIVDYERAMRGEPLFLEEADRALRETLGAL